MFWHPAGGERAKSGFFSTPQGTEKDPTVTIGSEARWANTSSDPACRLELIDDNAFLLTGYNPRQQGE
ncbi:hypothetical protein C8D88_12621 [Lentzea atacamensis]|uniref:Uncharacterized protein n=1 Tax=Lentzea atacamensis TaxID=531938 RepID=A0A316HBP5_9PSEU|nr:hypothetical protein [Lentzea atacamensis]PWK78629.1 hypothetical protein C8D88_12621 [Lentzea atacamensis]